MNMASVMPQAEKPADLINTSGKSDAVNRDDSVAEDNGIFSELLLMLSSSSGNNKAMPQNGGSMSLSSGPNQSGELQNAPLLKCETFPLARHAQTHNEDSGEQKAQLLRFESDSLVRHIQTHNEDSREERIITDMTDDYIHSPGADISLPAFGDTDSYKGSFDMDSFRDDFNKHLENVPETTVDAMPEIIPNLVPEVTKENSNESPPPHIYTNRTDIVSDLSERLADLYHIGGRSAKIRLQPEELGNLHIDISVVNDSINAIVTVEENSVKSIIEGNIDMLVEQLRRAGLDIDQFTVNIASSYYDGNIAGGWSDGNSEEMSNDNIFTPQPVYEDTVLSDSDAKLLYAGMAGGISIFA